MDENLYLDTRNKKGQKFGNYLKYKKEKSTKYEKIINKIISDEKKEGLYEDPLEDERLSHLRNCSWYRCRHHHHCYMCHPKKPKVNKLDKPKTVFRIKEYKNMNFDFIVNQ